MQPDTHTTKKWLTWRSWHRWVGLVFAIFILLFCVSGIIMNHRSLVSHIEVSRWWLPSAYKLENWNGGIVKGTVDLSDIDLPGSALNGGKKLVAYGQYGTFLTDADFTKVEDYNQGFEEGVDHRQIKHLVKTSDHTLWAAANFDLYRRRPSDDRWTRIPLDGNDERLSDIALRDDTLLVMTRSAFYASGDGGKTFERIELQTPEGYKPEVSLFKHVWMIHSGELFGTVGKIVVDLLGIVLIILCLTGITYFILPYSLKHTNRKMRTYDKEKDSDKITAAKASIKRQAGWMKWNLKWHNRLGYWLIGLTLLLSVTGMCLRPPLMVPLALTKTRPLPGTTLDNENIFHDKLRGVRWDEQLGLWIIITNEGFYAIDEDLKHSLPVMIPNAPAVSPMGVNVFERNPQSTVRDSLGNVVYHTEWLIGSFSGLFVWNPLQDQVTDYFTREPYQQPTGRPIGSVMVSGFSTDLLADPEIVFEYNEGPCVRTMPPTAPLMMQAPEMPELLTSQPMSLWNFALELHTGRCYESLLGPLSVMFIFMAGLLLTLILVSGFILYRRSHRKK